ncbi:unnamed protein product [Pedinophyceae sp. YPF-701]|nr:unnamed protein product [Pedinophyceae sp. YPF-701]
MAAQRRRRIAVEPRDTPKLAPQSVPQPAPPEVAPESAAPAGSTQTGHSLQSYRDRRAALAASADAPRSSRPGAARAPSGEPPGSRTQRTQSRQGARVAARHQPEQAAPRPDPPEPRGATPFVAGTVASSAELMATQMQDALEAQELEEAKERERLRQQVQEVEDSVDEEAEAARKRSLGDAVSEWQTRLRAQVELERAEEVAALQQSFEGPSLGRLQADGLILAGLAVVDGPRALFSQEVFTFALPKGGRLPAHRLRVRDPVATRPLSEDVPEALADVCGQLDGTVVRFTAEEIEVAFESGARGALEQVVEHLRARRSKVACWCIAPGAQSGTYDRQVEAIRRLGSFRNRRGTDRRRAEMTLRAALLGALRGQDMLGVAGRAPLWAGHGPWREAATRAFRAVEGLNDSQKRAVFDALSRSLVLWQGPPGTGKTRTLLSLLAVMVQASRAQAATSGVLPDAADVGPILACAGTNAAVDNIVEGLLKRGVRVVRIGQPAKVRPSLHKCVLEAIVLEGTAAGRQASELRRKSEALLARIALAREGKHHDPTTGRPLPPVATDRLDREERRAKEWASQARTLIKRGQDEVLGRAEVVAATCAGAADPALSGMLFRMVVVDEATQIVEPSCIIPLVRGAECVVMAGDPRQLPPTVVSGEAAKLGLGETLFERLGDAGLAPLLLRTQYRMHPLIVEAPSRMFYGGQLEAGVAAEDRPLVPCLPWPDPDGKGARPVMFVDTSGSREASDRSMSYRNAEEATVAAGLVALASHAFGARDGGAVGAAEADDDHEPVSSVAVLAPYAAQLRLLTRSLRRAGLAVDRQDLDVSTVDGYQGREADLVVFTAVRSNDHGNLGFVSDPRRLNVAVTRARRGLVVVGSADTLCSDRHWARWLQWADRKGLCVDSQVVYDALERAGIDPPRPGPRGDRRPRGDPAVESPGPRSPARSGQRGPAR